MRDGGRLVATAALLPYSPGNAWISMVLVTENWQRRGLATRLMDACLNAAKERGLTAWLDATPAGAAVYGPLGFQPTLQLRRLRLVKTTPVGSEAPLVAYDFDAFRMRDTETMGLARGDLLGELSRRPGSRLISNGDASALIRDGRTARHIGPLFADSTNGALALVHDDRRVRDRPIADRCDCRARRLFDGSDGCRMAHRAAFPAHAIRPIDLRERPKPPFAAAGPEYG